MWHSSTEGCYENRDPGAGRPLELARQVPRPMPTATSRSAGIEAVHSYPIPVDGPVGDLLRAQGRANMRPAHLHFLIYKPGYKTHISQVYANDDKNLETDAQFGVTKRAY